MVGRLGCDRSAETEPAESPVPLISTIVPGPTWAAEPPPFMVDCSALAVILALVDTEAL